MATDAPHILYVSGNLVLPDEPGPQRAWQQAAFWVRSGFRVTVLCANRSFQTQELRPGCRRGEVRRAEIDGAEVLFVPVSRRRRGSLVSRLTHYLSLLVGSWRAGRRIRRADLVYVRNLPPGLGLVGWRIARSLRLPLVQAIVDLHPETAVATGQLRNRLLVGLWEALENFSRRRSRLLVAHAPEQRAALLDKGYAPGEIELVTHAVRVGDGGAEPSPATRALLEGVPGSFWALFAGTMAESIDLDVCLDAARRLGGELPELAFVFVGDGEHRQRLQRRVSEEGLSSCHFLPPIPYREIAAVLRRARVLLLPVDAEWARRLGAPRTNKFFGYLAAGRGVLYAGSGAMAETIREVGCGVVTAPGDAAALAAAIRRLYREPEELEAMGRRGREWVNDHYGEEAVFSPLNRRLRELIPEVGAP